MGKAMKGGPAQKHLHSRISYLYQAATYLADNATRRQSARARLRYDSGSNQTKEGDYKCSAPEPGPTPEGNLQISDTEDNQKEMSPLSGTSSSAVSSRQLLAHLRAVSRRTQIRLTPDIKRSICKRCDALLVPGSTSTITVENRSRNRNKPWADVSVVTCIACGTAKRFPVQAERQSKRQMRRKDVKEKSVIEPEATCSRSVH